MFMTALLFDGKNHKLYREGHLRAPGLG